MIMNVAVPLLKHSPMFGHDASCVQAVLAQDLLDLVEARARRRANADPFGFGQPFGRDDLDGNSRGLRRALVLDAGGVVSGGGRRRFGSHR
jgi:hypothetical protein